MRTRPLPADLRNPASPPLPNQRSTVAATAQPIPPPQDGGVLSEHQSRSSSGDSMSPNLASSPLESLAAISTALPNSATGNTPGAGADGVSYRDRQDSYESPAVGALPENDVLSARRHSLDGPDDALRRYRGASR